MENLTPDTFIWRGVCLILIGGKTEGTVSHALIGYLALNSDFRSKIFWNPSFNMAAVVLDAESDFSLALIVFLPGFIY